MNLDRRENPDELTTELLDSWHQKEADVRMALTKDDIDKNQPGRINAIKPEFLERFQLFIPYLPLSKLTKAQIARIKLEQFRDDMSELGYRF